MLYNIMDVEINDIVVKDGKNEILQVIERPAYINNNNIPFIKCQNIADNAIDFYMPRELSLRRVLKVDENSHLILLKKLFDDAFAAKTDHISLHYHPSKDDNKFKSYCFETVNIYNKELRCKVSQGFRGLGMHIYWLKMFHDKEITEFLGERFFNGEGIRIQNISENVYSMEYTLH